MLDSGEYQVIPKKRPNFVKMFSTFLAVLMLLDIFLGLYTGYQYTNLLFIVVFVILMLAGGVETYLWRVRWDMLADRIGLDINPQNRSIFRKPYLTGNRHGYETTIDSFTRGNRRNRRHYTRITILLPFATANPFSFKKRGLLNLNDTQIDIEEVDKTFTIRTSAPHMVHSIFQTTRLRQGLFDLVKQSKTMNLSVEGNRLTYHEKGRIVDVEYLAALYNFLHKISESVRHQSQVASQE